MEWWIETKLENGSQIPSPIIDSQYGGKFVLCIPKASTLILQEKADSL